MNETRWLLLGFAIGLWISVVVLLLGPRHADESHAAACGGCGTSCCAPHPPRFVPLPKMWVAPGTARFFCTNRDNGWGVLMDGGYGVVMDSGYGIVMDNGYGIVMDNGYGVVMDGGYGVVMDSSGHPGSDSDIDSNVPRSPVPNGTELGRPRDAKEFVCAVNAAGGGFVEDRTGRRVTVPILANAAYKCISEGGSATVINHPDHNRVTFTSAGNPVVDLNAGEVNPVPGNAKTSAPHGTDKFLYCMVAAVGSTPKILAGDGTVVVP